VALVKVSALFAYMDDDLGRPGRIIPVPVAFGRSRTREKIGQPLRTGRKFLCEICAAAENNYKANRGKDWDDFRGFHSAGDANCIVTRFNGKWHRGFIGICDEKVAISMPLAGLQKERPISCALTILLGLTLPGDGIRSFNGHNYRAGNDIVRKQNSAHSSAAD